MEIDKQIPTQEVKQRKGFGDILIDLVRGILFLIAIPFKASKRAYDYISDDNNKIRKYHSWMRKERYRKKRANKINDEF